MFTHIKRAPKILAALLLCLAFVLSTVFFSVPSAHADEATNENSKISQMISSTLEKVVVAKKHEDFKDASKAGDFYFAQSGSGRCTITSVAMMLRRAAYLDGDENWDAINGSSVAYDGWTSAGVKNSFSSFGYDVNFVSVSGTTDSLRTLLDEHPEGVAIYDPGVPHAVLLTDYDEESGIFYCADPANYYSGNRIPLADSWNGAVRGKSQGAVVSGISRAWIIQ